MSWLAVLEVAVMKFDRIEFSAKITSFEVHDVRFPTSLSLDGSDAVVGFVVLILFLVCVDY